MKDFHRKRHVLIDSLLLEKSEVLEHHADLLPDLRYFALFDLCYILAGKDDPAAVRLDLLEYESDEGCLAGAAWPHKKNKVAAVNMHTGIYQPDIVSILFCYVIEYYHALSSVSA